ncbi:unnamed protein product [Periconia digitata]|uniref:Rhodopsin domain-containing protein n=1 Tax=Periconia digitata TaxID=1303443 RepID=A0A9W4XI18_9PLEO|nr:unnamed protein product [Periconia digitata]
MALYRLAMGEPLSSPPPLVMTVRPGPDDDRGKELAVVYILGCAISVIFGALRCYARIMSRATQIDDWFMYITVIMYIPLTVIITIYALQGGTRHLFYLAQDFEKAVYLTKLNWISTIFAVICFSTGKISIALLIVRLLGRTSRWRKWLLYFVSGLSVVNGIGAILINFLQCKDVNAIWDPRLKPFTECWDYEVQAGFGLYSACINTSLDFLLALLPVPMVINLNMSLATKIGLLVVLSCGIVTGVISALKTSTLHSLNAGSDITWDTYMLYIWVSVEITLVIVLGSLPPLRTLFRKAGGTKAGNSTSGEDRYALSSLRNVRSRKSAYSEIGEVMHGTTLEEDGNGRVEGRREGDRSLGVP